VATSASRGKIERRLVLALLLTSLVPLFAAIYWANSALTEAASIWFNPDVGRQLDHGLDVYKDYVNLIKDDMRHQTDALAEDEGLRAAVRDKDESRIGASLAALFEGHPDLAALDVRAPSGAPIASRDRGRPIDEATERSLKVTRPLSADADEGPALVATFAVARARVEEQEITGKVVRTYHLLESSRDEWYRKTILVFAALVGSTMLITLVSGTFLARSVTRRVSRLSAALNLVAKGDMSIRVPETGSDELTDLGKTFNHMLGEMDASRARIEFLQRIGAWQEMAQRLAHEIKNPLTPIQLAVQECHRKYPGDDPRFRALLDTTLEIVEEEVGTLRRLVGDFSNFARLPQAELREADLRDFLRECSEQLGHLEIAPDGLADGALDGEQLATSDVEVTWVVPDETLPASIDKQMLRRVLVNLVRNAVQAVRGAGEPGKVHGHVRVSATAGPNGEGTTLVVEDDGPGIPVDKRGRVFDPYFTTKSDGTGLGLAIVKKIVVEHGGAIDVCASERLGGASFNVHLPAPTTRELAALGEARDRASLRDLSTSA
jgi:nitrogen fixation/metabolism regulation signal transduction histidine kinase